MNGAVARGTGFQPVFAAEDTGCKPVPRERQLRDAMIDRETFERNLTRRTFLRRSAGGVGVAALASLLNPELLFGATTAPATAAAAATGPVKVPGILGM